MPTLTYPATLPSPSTPAQWSPAPRLVATDGAPYQARAIERDERAQMRITFVLSDEEAGDWWAWWRDDLVRGAAHFQAAWLTPRGDAPRVWRFEGVPQQRAGGAGIRTITATVSMRGASRAPQV
jgi:hypothetical protein